MSEVMPSRNFPFRGWCKAKGFSYRKGYDLVDAGVLKTIVFGGRRYVTEEEDQRFDAVMRSVSAVEPLAHRPEKFRKKSVARNA